jgi:hypothetical protein
VLEEWREYRKVINRLSILLLAVCIFTVLSYVSVITIRSAELDLTRAELRRLATRIDAVDERSAKLADDISRMVSENHAAMDVVVRFFRQTVRVQRPDHEDPH